MRNLTIEKVYFHCYVLNLAVFIQILFYQKLKKCKYQNFSLPQYFCTIEFSEFFLYNHFNYIFTDFKVIKIFQFIFEFFQ